MKRFLRGNWPFAIWIAAILAAFAPAWGKFTVLVSPDSPATPLNEPGYILNQMLSGMSGIDFHDFLYLILPPYTLCDFTYPFDTLLVAAAFAWFLRTRGVGRLASIFGGGAFAMMGYSLTLISAGHRGFFYMTVYAMLMFAFVARAMAGKGMANWALAGVSAAWALRRQVDFAAIYCILAAIYGIGLAIRDLSASRWSGRCIRGLLAGVALAAGSLVLAAAPTFRNTLLGIYEGRKSDAAGLAARAKPGDGDAVAEADAEAAREAAESKWIFTTNWSLPPDEALEFVAPSVMGRQTGDPSLPYWGRLGRTWKWEETRQGFMNFRQHAIYLGSIPLMLALLSLLLLAASAGTGNAEHLFESQSPAFQIRRFKFDIVFWSVVWLVALLLAFGRYTPFYRLFSALPFVSYMRAPVKFVRLLEFSTAFLAAVGLDALSRGEGRRPLRRAAVVAAALAVAFGAFATLVAARPSVFLSPLAALGADATLMRLMGANAVRALTHAILGFGFFAAVAWWRSRRAGARAGGFAAVALAVFVATDAALVVRPFAVTKNDEYRYTGRNPVQQMAASLPLDSGQPSVALYISNAALRRAQRENLECHGAAAQPRDDVDYRPFLSAAGREGFLSLAELTGCQFAVIAASEAAALPRGRATPVCGLAPRNPPALFEKTLTPANGDYRLVRLANAVPDASLFTRWTATTDDALFAEAGRQARRGLSRMSLPVVGAGQTNAATAATADNSAVAADVAPRRARVRAVMGLRGMRRTVVETDSEADAFLLLHRRFEARNGAWVDGVAAPQYRAGLDETAVFVPAGRHEVVLSSARRSSSWAAVMALVLAAYAFGLVLEGARG